MSLWTRTHGLRIGAITLLLSGVVALTACEDQDHKWGPSELRVATLELGSPTAPPPRLAPGETFQMEAAALDRDGKVVPVSELPLDWVTSDPGIASIDRHGVLRGLKEGIVTVEVTLNKLSASQSVLVQYYGASIEVLPAASALDPGETVQLAATVRDAEGNVLAHQVTWRSTNTAVATVNASGLVNAVAVGQAGIEVATNDILGLAQVTVQEPVVSIEVLPATVALAPGETTTLVATPRDRNGVALNRPVAWTSGNTAVAIVDVAGVVTALDLGVATIEAGHKGKKGGAEVTVRVPVDRIVVTSPTHGSEPLEVGLTRQLTAQALDAAGNVLDRPITWQSADDAIATVDQAGLVTGVGRGTVTISARAEGKTGSLDVKVVGESTTEAGNNLSVPVIFAEGYGISLLPVATETGLRGPTDGTVIEAWPFFFETNAPDCGTTFFCQGGANLWQAEWADGSTMGILDAEVAFGDNLTHHAYNTHANIHVEISLFAFAAPQMTGFNMPFSQGTGETEIQGTDGSTALMVPAIYTAGARLVIEKLDDVTRLPVYTVINQAIHEGGGGEGESGFSTEVNLGGKVSYGFNLMIQQLPIPSDIHKYGWYRITFKLDDAAVLGGLPVARNVALARLATGEDGEEGETAMFVPQIDPATNTAWVDIEVKSASGGGGGGGGGH